MPDPISWEFAWPYLVAALLGGYLPGSVPFGLALTKLAGIGDLRGIGSGNIGATNVLRTGRKDLAAATLALDGGKGAATVLIGWIWGPDTALMAGLGAMLGHLFPVWLRFKGGKGIATAFGVLLAIAWPVGLACGLVWLTVAFAFRISSLAAVLTALAAPPLAWFLTADPQIARFTAILAVLVLSKHASNMRRLLKGEEPKIGRK